MTRVRPPPPFTPRRSTVLPRWLAVLVALAPGSVLAQNAFVSVDDPSPTHVHPPGQTFTVGVTVSDPGIAGAGLFAQWLAPDGTTLAPPVALAPGQRRDITSPGTAPGHYDLRVWSDSSAVRFVPQDAGFHMDFGFAILPVAQVADRTLDDESFFGMVHADRSDPYLRGWIKTMTLDTATPANFAQRIKDYQQQDRLQELPMVNGDEWDTDNSVPISDAQLDLLGNRFGTYLDALLDAGVHVPAWQLGREENRNGRFELPQFFANLERKAGRLRAELDQRGLQDVATVFSMRGFNYGWFADFAASEAAQHFDVLGFHPYKWNDFPSPEDDDEWLRNHIETVAQIMQDNGGPTRLWMTEFGIPHQGNHNPEGFYGYPASGAIVQGGSREHSARYIVKSHVVSMATELVEKIFYYNYHDRGDDHTYAEHHFGLRMHAPLTTSSDDTHDGHTKPAYVAYATMVRQLDDRRFVDATRVGDDVWVYAFADETPGGTGQTIVAWTTPGSSATVALADLRPGLTPAQVVAASDLYGTPLELAGDSIALDPRPVYLRIDADEPVIDHAPIARDDSVETEDGASVAIVVLANDGGLEDTPLTVAVLAAPAHGNATVLATNVVVYAPDPGFSGSDGFTYRVEDGDGDSDSATVTVTVTAPPAEPPGVTLDVAPAVVTEGGEVTLAWTSTDAEACVASGDWTGNLAAQGERIVGPLFADGAFTLVCSGAGGAAEASVSVEVIPAAADSDGDALPDDWEQSWFGDLSADADGDPDSDGLNNGEEFAYATDPTTADSDGDGASDGDEIAYGSNPNDAQDNWQAHRPERPVVQPQPEPVPLRKHVMDVTQAYEDPDSDRMDSADWQIATDASFADLLLDRRVQGDTALRIPAGVMQLASTYHVRTRHRDAQGLPSLWSEPAVVLTYDQDPQDTDGDGMADAYQVNEFTDVDANGLEDNAETRMCAMYDAETRQVIGIRTDAGEVRCIAAIPDSDIPAELGIEEQLPYGMFAFRVVGLPVDAANPARVTATVYLPEALTADTQWLLYDEAGFLLTPYDGALSQQGKIITLSYVDGGLGDKDGIVNGIVVDPIGPAVAAATPPAPAPPPSPTTSVADSSGGGGAGGVSLLALLALYRLRGSLSAR